MSVFWLALAAFAIGTEGFVIAGLLPSIAADLSISVPAAGQLVTAYALTYAVGSPILAVTLSNIDRCWCLAARPQSGTCLAASWRTGSVR